MSGYEGQGPEFPEIQQKMIDALNIISRAQYD